MNAEVHLLSAAEGAVVPRVSHSEDVNELHRLNSDYIAADQGSDVARYEHFLAPDFTATLPDLLFRDRNQFLELIGRPRPFRELTAHDVAVRILGDVALVHGRVTYTTIL